MIRGGYPFYGQRVGILVFDQKSPRVPGDPGHSSTFDFQVCYEIIDGQFRELISGSDEIKIKLISAVKNLESKGIKAVIGDCGLMALYQREISACTSIPVLSSSLVLVPLIWNLIGRIGSIGIITGHSSLLNREHLKKVGITKDINIVIQGMEEEPHFCEVVINGGLDLNVDLMREDVLTATQKLLNRCNSIRAILLECSNLATYSRYIHDKTDIPVFDIVAGARLLEYSVNPPDYLVM